MEHAFYIYHPVGNVKISRAKKGTGPPLANCRCGRKMGLSRFSPTKDPGGNITMRVLILGLVTIAGIAGFSLNSLIRKP